MRARKDEAIVHVMSCQRFVHQSFAAAVEAVWLVSTDDEAVFALEATIIPDDPTVTTHGFGTLCASLLVFVRYRMVIGRPNVDVFDR